MSKPAYGLTLSPADSPVGRSRLASLLDAWPTAGLIAAGVVLPNLLSVLTLLLDIGLPPRTSAIFLYFAIALMARQLPFVALVAAAFVGALAFDLVSTIALLFNLAPSEIVAAVRYAGFLRIYASPLYLGLVVAIAISTAASLALLSHRETMRRANPVIVFIAACALATIDFALHVSPHYHFGSWMGRGVPVQSAAKASGFMQAAPNGRNVILVLVEGMGKLLDPAKRAAVAEPLASPAIAARYRLTEGSVTYYGSTTAAEMREFCDTRDGYDTLTAERGAECLPARLRRAGYATIAVHGYSGEMFDRNAWYPKIGIDQFLSGEKFLRRGSRICGSVFRGACDSDMEDMLAGHLKGAKQPTFLYWLTLNTHVPVKPGEAKSNLKCERYDAAEGEICHMSELWRDVFANVARIAADPALAPAEILIVGDHAPPLWSMRGRRMFEPGQVSWYRLTPR